MQRRVAGYSTLGHKGLVLEQLKRTGSLNFTPEMLGELYGEVEREIEIFEESLGVKNPSIRLLLAFYGCRPAFSWLVSRAEGFCWCNHLVPSAPVTFRMSRRFSS